MLMAEWNLLNARHTLISRGRRHIDCINQTPKSKKAYEDPDQCRSRETIAALPKNLSHVPPPKPRHASSSSAPDQ